MVQMPQQVAATSLQQQHAETVLLVDDDAVQRKLVQELLREEGYTVLQACDGFEALETCRRYQGPIHLLITDVVMPRMMSGPELAESLSVVRPLLKVLYSSAYTDDSIMSHSLLRPNAAFLPKPFMPAMLKDKVREVLNSASQQGRSQV